MTELMAAVPDSQEASTAPYSEKSSAKSVRLLGELTELTAWHNRNCQEYAGILKVLYGGRETFLSLDDAPFLPVRLFKLLRLASVPAADIVRTLTSSGTSSQIPSRIVLDKATASAQSKALITIVKSFLGSKRLPMAIIDHPGVLKDRDVFSARGAGIVGFSQFGREPVYLLDNDMQVNWTAVSSFVEKTLGSQVFLFGFTFMVWRYLYKACIDRGHRLDFGDSILIHGGGWKKLSEQSVSNQQFKEELSEQLGIRRIYNYYGMVEQSGSIFMECEAGFFHCSSYSDVLIRHPDTLDVLPFGLSGLLQIFSSIPRSYPGHSLLSEDLGTIIGEDDCTCGRAGKYFTIQGRLPQSELRGCSDTHQETVPWNS